MRGFVFLLVGAGVVAFLFGFFFAPDDVSEDPVAVASNGATYSSGWYKADFYDGAYAKANGEANDAMSGVVAHHLLVADKIAEVFESLASESVETVVIVSPNHFDRGLAPAQVSTGEWTTPFGAVASDTAAVAALLARVPFLWHEEEAFTEEHGIYGLTPFVARSFPNARIVSIVVSDGMSVDNARRLGETIAAVLPEAVLLASVDMTHYRDAAYTAENDAKVLALLAADGWCGTTPCTDDLDIDSNASLRVLFGFNAVRGTEAWHLTHHGSSLAMGAAANASDNTSHILGYFLSSRPVLYSP